MKLTRKTIVLACGLLLVGCKTMDGGSLGGLVDGATMAVKATSLSDEEVIATSKQACEALDAQNRVADSKSKYTQRLNKVIAKMPTEINGIKAVYKVYLTNDVNAWAMDNGCIRVYSGLMDAMNDDELRGIIGHEIGHVALGHSKKSMQTAYATAAARTIAANSSNAAVASLSSSQLGDLGQKFVNAQFSQSQESAADDHSFDLLTQKGMERKGLVTGFEKIAKLEGGKHSMMDSHPPSAERAKRMQARLSGK